ncbi:ATP synthase subunit O- mitochondrial [Striga hermonthica]|uniref:ATP synthase subunit O- mitochondrial n=1 Tax=Striga hermonthica TaxID=68872 RepID=A0A9N7NB66_STRHE|nr:ATP synthase subunit O- mitochondrial [Striga hermonthica]
MAMTARLRSGLPLLRRALNAGNLFAAERSVASVAAVCPIVSKPEFARSYASSPPANQQKVKVPLKLYGVSGNYATALYIAAVKANVLDKVESELHTLIQASKKSPTFSQFMKDLSVTADTRVKAIKDICAETKFSEITKNFLVVVAESGRLGHLERIEQRFSELTMAHRGEVKATVTTVIPLPPEEEKELKETLQHILGQGTKVKVEQKILELSSSIKIDHSQTSNRSKIPSLYRHISAFIIHRLHNPSACRAYPLGSANLQTPYDRRGDPVSNGVFSGNEEI